MPHKVTPPIERFMRLVNKEGSIHELHGQCWEWTGTKNKHGYGKFRNTTNQKDSLVYAHIFSFEHWFWKVPEGYVVCHKCDNPSCVNPDHLFSGTPKDNMQDAVSKGRTRKGVLSKEKINAIKSLDGVIPQSKIAKKFGFTQSHISNLLRNKYKNYEVTK